ncbi:hypothetical protein Nepgr_016816 [Nepenthes gracilis]|uniref:Uncharacterized protein n=1 Tax=Nepenthes gracilis TaxID=150966 RepID=A0AAD3SNA4_NEPGR|nr:hypothetical protein Nepgr_016816 [Nepenthes gracilis]
MAVNHRLGPIFRSDWHNNHGGEQYQGSYLEKRQLFLRSYQFSRKKSFAERIKVSLVKVKRIIWLRLRSARKLRKIVWSRLRSALFYRRRRFSQLLFQNNYCYNNYHYYFLYGSSIRSESSCSC